MKKIIAAVDQEIRHALRVNHLLTSPARVQQVDEMTTRAYRLIENVSVLVSELRDLVDQMEGPAPRVNTRGLLGKLRVAEVELDAAVECLAGELGLVEGAP
jgi:hypothetical protein